MKKALLAFAVSLVLAAGIRAGNDDDFDHYPDHFEFKPGTLVLSRSVYVGTPSLLVPGVTVLPPGCVAGNVSVPLIAGGTVSVAVSCSTPTNDGTFPTVFNNAAADGHFGITSPVFLDDLTTDGHRIGTLPIPTDQIVTSFTSKSELAIHLSTDGKSVTFVGYHGGPGFVTGPNIFDVSNGNTPGLIDPTNAAVGQYYRSVAEIDSHGHIMVTDGNAYSGDNGRGAFKGGNSLYYMVGNDNSGNLSKKQVSMTIVGQELVNDTGAELLIPGQTPPVPPNVTKIGKFSITQVTDPLTGKSYAADKPGKDDNYRGITIFNNTLYITKGSGGNGINTVYQVGSAGVLPTGDEATLATVPITILPGFPTTLAGGQDPTTNAITPVIYPFGIWFADANTLYVADEGDNCTSYDSIICTDILQTGTPDQIGASIYAHATHQTGGLQKWIYDSTESKWNLAYSITAGLNLGVPQTIANYPTGINGGSTGTNLPWAPATDGLRNLTGRVNHDGTVTIWAVTSTVSGSGDEGADPNQLVSVTDRLCDSTLATGDGDHDRGDRLDVFKTIRSAKPGEVYRGITFAPQDRDDDHGDWQ